MSVANQPSYSSQGTIEYVTPNLGQGHYIDRINELIPLLSEGKRGDKLRVFLGRIFPLYFVARADYSDGEELKKIVLKALFETTRDKDFKEAIEGLMNTTSEPAIRKIAARLRNSEYLKKYGIYLGVDLVSVNEGKNGNRVVNVLYATAHEINKRNLKINKNIIQTQILSILKNLSTKTEENAMIRQD